MTYPHFRKWLELVIEFEAPELRNVLDRVAEVVKTGIGPPPYRMRLDDLQPFVVRARNVLSSRVGR